MALADIQQRILLAVKSVDARTFGQIVGQPRRQMRGQGVRAENGVHRGRELRLRQLAAQRVEGRDELNRLLKRLQGKDKSVYRILKDKRDALRAEVQEAAHVEQDIRTIYTSLEALLSKPYDALFPPALELFEARWRNFEGQAQPWARDRVRVAIDRCRAVLAGQLREAEEHAARLAEHSARQIALQRAREDAEAQAAQAERERSEAAALAAAAAEELRQAEEKARAERQAADALAFRQIATLMARAHGALRAGHTGPAAGLRRAIEEKCTAAPALPASLARGLQELDAKLHALKEWKDYAVSPKRCGSLIRFSISHRTTWAPSYTRRLSRKQRAIFRGLLRSSLRSTLLLPTTPWPWRHRFTKRSWSVALRKLSLG
jgi:hypothetical protein